MTSLDGIDMVLEQRRQWSAVLRTRVDAMHRLNETLQASERSIASIPDPASGQDRPAALQSAMFASGEAQAAVDTESQACEALARRFDRPALTLGAVGRTGQGKSEFLKTLTGLTDREIPTGSGGFCTGVSTVVRFGAPKAEVFFLSSEAYLDRVHKYYEELNLASRPVSLEDFWRSAPQQLSNPGRDATLDAAYEHLISQWQARDQVESLLGSSSRVINFDEIKDYVTQEAPDGAPRHAFRAVDHVEVAVEYPAGDPRIAVIDLPGLGDTNLTDIDLFLGAVRDEVDVLVLVRAGNQRRDQWMDVDVNLHTHAQRALPQIAMEERAFLLINEIPAEGNRRACERLVETLTLGVAGVDIVNVADRPAVGEYFLRLVGALPTSVGAADAKLMVERDRALDSVTGKVRAYVDAAASLIGISSPVTEMRKSKLVSTARKELAVGLEALLNQMKHDAGLPLSDLETHFRDVLAQAKSLVGQTSPEEFLARASERGSKSQAYNDLLQEMRARLGARFATLDPVLKRQLELAKGRIGDVLAKDGRWAPIVGPGGVEALSHFDLALKDPRLDLPADSPIRGALETLHEAELSYRGFLQHRIRQCFRELDPDSPLYPPSSFGEGDVRSVPPEVFLAAIDATTSSCLLGDQGVEFLLLHQNRGEATWAIFAIVEEFVERVLHSQGAEDEWDASYRRFQDRIWRDEFTEAAETDAMLSTALNALAEVGVLLGEVQSAKPREEVEV